MAMTLLCLMLLVGLLLYVMNVGWNAQARSTLQNAADSSAAAGAGWVARSFNTVALNNTSMAQLIAAVQVVDSVPLAVQLSRKEHHWLSEALHNQLSRGVNGSWVRDGLERLTVEVDKYVFDQQAGLEPLDEFFNHSGFDVRELTHYYGPGGQQGKFWVAIAAMDKLNLETMNQLGDQAVVNATMAARANPASGDSTNGLLLPVVPEVPWKRGHFDDYERPVKYGLLPGSDQRLYNPQPVPDGLGQVDDPVTQRGPWDTIFGWRRILGGGATGYWVPTTSQTSSGGQGNTPISGSAGGSGGGQFIQTGYTPPTHYELYGVMEWALRQAVRQDEDDARLLDRYDHRLSELAYLKLSYLWPGPLTHTGLRIRGYANASKKAANDPNWEIPIIKDYHFFFDGVNMKRSDPPAYEFFLEDGTNTTSDDCTLRVRDLRNGFTQITYLQPRGTVNWVYDVLDGQGNIVMEGLGRGVNGNNFGMSILIPTPPRQVVDPQWITNYNTALGYADNPTTRLQILETQYVAVEISSKYPVSDSRFLTEGTWRYVNRDNPSMRNPFARIVYRAGWLDPREWNLPMVSSYIWRDQWEYQANFDTIIGINPAFVLTINGNEHRLNDESRQISFTFNGITYTITYDPQRPIITWVNPDGSTASISLQVWVAQQNSPNVELGYEPQTVYCIDDFMFAGINVGTLIDVRNPNPLAQDINEKLAAPVDFEHAQMPPDKAGEGVRKSRLTMLGLAWRRGESAWWPGRFSLNNAPPAVAAAQVTIFNDHSWDLWTQMWNTRLELVRDMSGWADRLSQANQGGRLPVTISTEELDRVNQQLRAAEKLEPVMATH